MLKKLKNIIKSIIGRKNIKKIRPIYHGIRAILLSIWYFFPSQKVFLIGVNGTKGKSTTVIFISRLLNNLNHKTGFISSALIFDGEKEFLNTYKMGMLDPAITQKLIKKMVKNGCKFVVLETTSEGLEQNRHFGLKKFDLGVFLNIFPEHIEAHGSFLNYQKAKSKLPRYLKYGATYIINSNKEYTESLKTILSFVPKKLLKSFKMIKVDPESFVITNKKDKITLEFIYKSIVYNTNLISKVEIWDLIIAIKILENLPIHIREKELKLIITNLVGIPGRLEWIFLNGRQVFNGDKFVLQKKEEEIVTINNNYINKNLSIMVDYAHEPKSMENLLKTLESWKEKEFFDIIIHLVSADGVGRDDWKKPILGKLSFAHSDYSVFTTDNYQKEDNPKKILDLLTNDLTNLPDIDNKLIKVIDRFEAFKIAIKKANEYLEKNLKVIIVSTGVGTEYGLTQPSGVIEWDERKKWLEAYQFLNEEKKLIL